MATPTAAVPNSRSFRVLRFLMEIHGGFEFERRMEGGRELIWVTRQTRLARSPRRKIRGNDAKSNCTTCVTDGGRGRSADSRQAKEEGRHIPEEEQENPEEIARGRCPLPTGWARFQFRFQKTSKSLTRFEPKLLPCGSIVH